MRGATTLFMLLGVSGRSATSTRDTFEAIEFRNLAGMIISCVVFKLADHWHRVNYDHQMSLLNATGAVASLCLAGP
ncbi:MAG: hypothetical protein AB3N15_03725 [Paracoccaceae bacterium]